MAHREELKVRTSDCDKYLKLEASSVLDLFQESAGRDCLQYSLDSPTLIREKNLTWVLTGIALKFNEYPTWPTNVKIDTWTKSFKGFKALRDYRLFNEDNLSIIEGSSIWALLDIDSRRPIKLESLNNNIKLEEDNHVFTDIIPGKFDKLIGDYNSVSEIIVNKSDLDINNHVSNIRYLKWLFTYLDDNYIDDMELELVNISYRGESILGDNLSLKTSFNGFKALHSFVNKKTDKEICLMSTTWRKRG